MLLRRYPLLALILIAALCMIAAACNQRYDESGIDRAEFITWAQRDAYPIKVTGSKADDLKYLDSLFGGARVVGLGQLGE